MLADDWTIDRINTAIPSYRHSNAQLMCMNCNYNRVARACLLLPAAPLLRLLLLHAAW